MAPIEPTTWWFVTVVVTAAAIIRAFEIGWWLFGEDKNAPKKAEPAKQPRRAWYGNVHNEVRACARWILHFAIAILAVVGVQHWLALGPVAAPRLTGFGLWLLISTAAVVCVGLGYGTRWLRHRWARRQSVG